MPQVAGRVSGLVALLAWGAARGHLHEVTRLRGRLPCCGSSTRSTAVVVDWLVCGRVLTPLQMAGVALIGAAPWTLPAPPGATGGGRPVAGRLAAR